MTTKSKYLVFVICLFASYLTSTLGAVASISAGEFYAEVIRPSWAPPGWLFGPVWLFLYGAMAVSAALVWIKDGYKAVAVPLTLFFVHLIPNASWSWMFFYWRLGAESFANIIVLWLLIASLVVMFYRIRKIAGLLLIPYLLWVSFATALNYQVWQLNPNLL